VLPKKAGRGIKLKKCRDFWSFAFCAHREFTTSLPFNYKPYMNQIMGHYMVLGLKGHVHFR